MRFSPVQIAVVCVAVLNCAALRAQETEWPAAMFELERLALQSPRRNAAFSHLRQFASESGRLDEWRARWESRARTDGGAMESLLLGWFDIEAGQTKEARVWFARAAKLAPENPHALLAHAEMLIRACDADGETRARRAAELFTDTADKAGALRLASMIAQEKGELAAAWAHLGKLEGEPLPPDIRVALTADFTRAHLALGDWDKWFAALLESSGNSTAAAATCAAACLALGDPATAHRVVTEALKRDPGDNLLGNLATAAAIAAGFGGDAAMRIEAALGAQPSDDDLAAAINTLAALGAPEHARRIFNRHPARLAPIAARWRQVLPLLWNLGATEGLRDVLAPHAAVGGWELQFVLCELALLEKNPSAAEQALWRVLSREFDGHELPSSTRALARKAIFNPPDVPLAGQHLRSRCYSWDSAVHTDRPVHSLTQARDMALRDLGQMASKTGGDALDKLAATLRERTAHWLPGERLLAFYFARQREGILEAAEAAAALPNPSLDMRGCIRVALSTIGKVPPIPEEFIARTNVLKARFPFEKHTPSEDLLPQSWRARLFACWQLIGAGKLIDADKAFAAALHDFAEDGTGPDASAWSSFHASLIHSVMQLQDQALKTEAAAQVLRWIGMQTPRRVDWPAAPRPQVLWTKSSGQKVHSMFGGGGSTFVAHSFEPEVQQTAVGGSVTSDLFAPLAYFTHCFSYLDQRALGKALDAMLRDLPEESVRTALLARGVAAASDQVSGDPAWFAPLRESCDAQPAQIAAAISSLSAARFGRTLSFGDIGAELQKAAPPGSIGRAAWLAAALHAIAHGKGSSDPVRLAAELATLPADADTRRAADAAIEMLLSKARPDAAELRTVAGKLALAWLGTDETVPLPVEWRSRLRILMNSAEIDAAAALAKKILAQPLKPGTRLPEPGGIRLEAIRALNAVGELPAWFSSLNKNASRDNPSDLQRLAQAAREILDVVKATGARPAEKELPPEGRRKIEHPGGLDESLLREARAAQFDAEVRLVHLEPEEIDHWTALWFSAADGREPGEKLGEKPVVESATLLRAARGGLLPEMAFHFAGDDPRNVVDLAARWPAPPAQEPIRDTVEIASRLWHVGEKDAALDWLRKMSGTAPFFLIEALAARGDSAGIVDALATALLAAAQQPPKLSLAFQLGRESGFYLKDRPLAPLLDEASALGLSAPLAAKLAADPTPNAAALGLLVRAREHDATAASAITAYLAKPQWPVLNEEFAWQLAGWPEGRDGAQAALRALRQSHPFSGAAIASPGLQPARFGWLAARCGMESEAHSWLNQAWGMRNIPSMQHGEMLLTVAEGMWQNGDRARARAATGDLVKSLANNSKETGRIATRLRQLAAQEDPELVRLLCDMLSATKPPADSELSVAISEATRIVAIREGRFFDLTPFAWVRAQRADGVRGLGWALGYSTRGRENRQVLRAPDFPQTKSLRDLRLEIFEGTTNERLARRATIANPSPFGRVRISTKELGSTTSAILSTGILGPTLHAIEGEELLPPTGEIPGTLLPALIWKKRANGPDGDTIVSSHRPSQGSSYGDLFRASIIELPAAAGKDIVISGWARHEKPNMMDEAAILVIRPRDDASGRWVLQHTITAAPLGGDWQRFETRIRAPQAVQAGRAAPVLALQLLPGCAYSGLRVTATAPTKNGDGALKR